MKTSRMSVETHWRNVGAAVAGRHGSLADLDRVLTKSPAINAFIREGYETRLRRDASKAVRLARTAAPVAPRAQLQGRG